MDKYEEIKAERRKKELGSYPQMRAQAIARHYTSVAAMAGRLDGLVRSAQLTPEPPKEVTDAIDDLTNQIKEAHLRDLGLPLKWGVDIHAALAALTDKARANGGDLAAVADFREEIELRAGWAFGDVVAYFSLTEEVNPAIGEAEALRRMAEISSRYK